MALVSELLTTLKLDSSQFKSAAEEATNSIKQLSSGFQSLVALAATAAIVKGIHEITDAFNESIHSVEELIDSSKRLGESVQGMQRLQFAAQASGVGVDQLNTAMTFLEKNLGRLEAGTAGAALPKYMQALGLNLNDILAMPIDEKFNTILTAVNALPDPIERTTARVALFGKSGNSLGALQDNFKSLEATFDQLGSALGDDQIQKVEEYRIATTELSSVWEGFKQQLAIGAVPALKELVNWIVENIKQMGGIKAIATNVASTIVTFAKTMADGWHTFNLEIDFGIILLEKMSVILLKINEYATLGLSRVFTNIHQDIGNIQADINKREIALTVPKGATAASMNETNAISSVSSQLTPSNQLSTDAFRQLGIQKTISDEYRDQLNSLKEAVKLQKDKVDLASKEQQMVQDLIAGRGGEDERLKQSIDSVKKIHDEFLAMQKNTPADPTYNADGLVNDTPSNVMNNSLNNASGELVQKVSDAFDKFDEYTQKLNDDSKANGDFVNNRLNDFLQVLQHFNDSSNQFGAGNTTREQKVALEVTVKAEQGFEAKVAQSQANKDVVTSIVNQELSDAVRGEE